MKFRGKWFSCISVLAVVFLLISSVPALASTTKMSVFYQDPVKLTCEHCDPYLYSGSNGIVFQVSYHSSKITAISAEGKKLWTYKLPKISFLSYKTGVTADQKGNVYFGIEKSDSYYLVSLNAKGTINWEFKMDNPNGPNTPIFDKNGNVYFGTGNPTDYIGPYGKSDFYALTSKGKKKWRITLNGDSMLSIIQFDKNQNLVIPTTNAESAWTYTISMAGKVISSIQTNSFANIAWNEYYIDGKSSTLKSIDKNGKALWSYKVTEDTELKYVSNGTVYIASGGYLLAVSKGKLLWKTKAMGDFIYHKKGLYIIDKFSSNMDIKILDEKTGKIKTNKKLDSAYYRYTLHPSGNLLVSKGNSIYKVVF
jgi:outer membrane protein assembly factor BamB